MIRRHSSSLSSSYWTTTTSKSIKCESGFLLQLLCSSNKSSSSASYLPSHRNAHKPQMKRSPTLARAGNLERSHLISPKSTTQNYRYLPRGFVDPKYAAADSAASFDGQLDVWRHMIAHPMGNLSEIYTHHRGVPQKWEVIVPLLESIREAGRVNNFVLKNPNLQAREIPPREGSSFFEQRSEQEEKEQNENNDGETSSNPLSLLPTGHRFTPESISKQFLIELGVRLPLLENSLETTASPLLVARFCKTMRYCGVNIPTLTDFQNAPQGLLLDSRLRLRALVVAALRQSERQLSLLAEEEQEKMLFLGNNKSSSSAASSSLEGKIELRKRRKLTLECSNTSELFNFLEENKTTLMDYKSNKDNSNNSKSDDDSSPSLTIKQQIENSLESVLNIDMEKEIPRVLNWAREGKEFYEEQLQLEEGDSRKFSMISASKTTSKPVQWLSNGHQQKEERKALE